MRSILDVSFEQLQKYYYVLIENSSFKAEKRRMDATSFPVAAKDMAQMRGRKVGAPYLPNKLTGPGKAFDKMHSEMKKAGLI